MLRDRENTFCTSDTYRSANQSQATIVFSQPIIIEYTVLHHGWGIGRTHFAHLTPTNHSNSQPITGHYFIQPTKSEPSIQLSIMHRDRDSTFCTSDTSRSANQSQATISFSQPIRSEYTVFHNAEGQGEQMHIRHLQVSQPITVHYFIQPTNHNRVYNSMLSDREDTFCTSDTYRSANQSQATILFSQPIIIVYTVLHRV